MRTDDKSRLTLAAEFTSLVAGAATIIHVIVDLLS
jgi:hypothetical protein